MAILQDLRAEGWNLSNEGLNLCLESIERPTVALVIKQALDMDLREIGESFLPEDVSKGKLESISSPGIVQIQKIKNASAPKYDYGSGAPPILRLLLTDGTTYVNCLQWGPWKSITMETPPGTKIYLKAVKIPILNNFLLLTENQFNVLGGRVTSLVEKWELNKQLASHIRTKENLDGTGPPPWIPFGKQIISNKPLKSAGNFKALESDSKDAKEDEVFKQQRQAQIAQISRVKETKVKSFGGKREKVSLQSDSSNAPSYNPGNDYRNRNDRNENDSRPQYKTNDYHRSDNEHRQYKTNDYHRGDNDSRQYRNESDSRQQYTNYSQDSPARNKPYNNYENKGRRNPRNDTVPYRPDNRSQSASNSYGASENKAPNRSSTLEDFITQEIKFKAYDQNRNSSSSKMHKDFRGQSDKKTSETESGDLVNMMRQVSVHGYDTKHSVPTLNPLLKPGTEVMAKYWEDHQYYQAVVHAVGKEEKTCVVHFLDYGNYEEVLVDDIKEKNFKNRNWSAGPISFKPSARNSENYPSHHDGGYRDNNRNKGHQAPPPYQGSNRSYGARQDTYRQRPDYSKRYEPQNRRES